MRRQFSFQRTKLGGLFLIEPFHFTDERGGNMKNYAREIFLQNGIDFKPVETLFIHSRKDVLRGLHFQHTVWQSKLVCCLSGAVFAVAVDIRRKSPTCGQYVTVELTAENEMEMYIPDGFAFGTLALKDSLISCQCGAGFVGEYNDGILWNDEQLNIPWPLQALGSLPVLAEKDKQLQSWRIYLSKEQ